MTQEVLHGNEGLTLTARNLNIIVDALFTPVTYWIILDFQAKPSIHHLNFLSFIILILMYPNPLHFLFRLCNIFHQNDRLPLLPVIYGQQSSRSRDTL